LFVGSSSLDLRFAIEQGMGLFGTDFLLGKKSGDTAKNK